MADSSFILFVDMLGFAALVEENGDDLNGLAAVLEDGDDIRFPETPSLLGYRFSHFHRCLNRARRKLEAIGSGTTIAFSDSAFLRTESFEQAAGLAVSLMLELVTAGVPARMGLAHGSYRMLNSTQQGSASVAAHMSQFLGTAIVRAYSAERCGLPGLRIALHPNVDDFARASAFPTLAVQAQSGLRLAVNLELNYLEPKTNAWLGPDFDDVLPFDELRWMTGAADEQFQYHYIETYHLWNRMREQYGRPPYPWEKFLDRDEYDYQHGIRPRPESQ